MRPPISFLDPLDSYDVYIGVLKWWMSDGVMKQILKIAVMGQDQDFHVINANKTPQNVFLYFVQ